VLCSGLSPAQESHAVWKNAIGKTGVPVFLFVCQYSYLWDGEFVLLCCDIKVRARKFIIRNSDDFCVEISYGMTFFSELFILPSQHPIPFITLSQQ